MDNKNKDIEKIRVIHELKNKFNVDDTTVQTFIDQIETSNFKDNIDRFFRGYIVEDKFHILYSAIPWVKLVHSLGQQQLPSRSKESYQVPDYTILYETSSKEVRPILIEVKSVKGDKQGLEIMTRQVQACLRYAKTVNLPLLYAIHWEKYHTLTINTVDNFEVKTKHHKITLFDALKNDLAVIFGDLTAMVTAPIYRQTLCDSSITDTTAPTHEKFGVILGDKVSADNSTYIEINGVESAIIDSFLNMKTVDTTTDGTKTTLTEKSEGNYFFKLSTLILRHIAVFDIDLQEENTNMSRRLIIDFCKKLNIPLSYSIPTTRTDTSDKLFTEAFGNTWVKERYDDNIKE